MAANRNVEASPEVDLVLPDWLPQRQHRAFVAGRADGAAAAARYPLSREAAEALVRILDGGM